MDDTHIHKQIFFNLIQKRLFSYMDVIWGLGGWSQNIAAAVLYNSEQMQRIQATDDYIGKGFWGYGINRICDGKEWYTLPDIQEIKKLPELNKHLQPYRNLMVLTFKVEGDSLYVSTFALDSVSVGVNAKTNTKYQLRNFENARMVRLNNKLSVEFLFKDLPEPISFQLDSYYVPGYLSSDQLAKYYIENIKKQAQKFITAELTIQNKSAGSETNDSDIKNQIKTVETALRHCISATLMQLTGKQNYVDILPSDIKRTVNTRIQQEIQTHPARREEDFAPIGKALQFCDIDHLKKLVLNDRHWQSFVTIFQDKDKTSRYFEYLNALRNAMMHNREVNNIVLLEGKAAIEWFLAILK